MSNGTLRGGGITFPGMLAIVFITLKLTGHIDWSWVWVTSPLWISLLLRLTIIGLEELISHGER